MIYVFVCLSEKCIGTQQAIKIYKCIAPDSEQFADDQRFDQVSKLDDKALTKLGLLKDEKNKKNEKDEDSWEDGSDEEEQIEEKDVNELVAKNKIKEQ